MQRIFVLLYVVLIFLLATLVRWEYRRIKRRRKRGVFDAV
jgi:hypothetical protein